MGTVLPANAMCKFKAVDTWTPASHAAGGAASFYANNPYDPVVGASITKCSGWDAMMDLYSYAIVYGTKVVARFLPNTVNGVAYIWWTGSNISLPAAAPSLNYIREAPMNMLSKFTPIYAYNQKPCFLKSYMRMKYLEKRKELEPDDYKAVSNSGPSLLNGVQVGYVPADSANAQGFQWPIFIEITYYCKLFNRIPTLIAE